MRTRFLLLFFLFAIDASAQTHRIDSLKKRLPGLGDRTRVNCLNALGWEFNYWFVHSDSALKYAKLAWQYASDIGYNSGKAESLIIQGDVQGRLLGNQVEKERYCRQAIELLKNENDPKNLCTAYFMLAWSLAGEGMYDRALEAAFTARKISTTAGDKAGLAYSIMATGFIYCKSGEYWKGFENLVESQQMGKELHDSILTSFSLAFIARSFNHVGEPKKALSYYHQCLQFATPYLLLWPHVKDMAYAHLQLKNYDSVLFYQQKHLHNLDSLTTDQLVLKRFGALQSGYSIDVQLARHQYDTILAALLPVVGQQREKRDIIPLMQSLLNLGKVFNGKGNYQQSLQYTRELLHWARQANSKQFLKEGNQLMAALFDRLKQSDSAYSYFRQYTVVKDSMESAQFTQRAMLHLAASEGENRIRLLKKDKEINEQQLALNKKELSKQGQLKNLLVASLVVLLLLSMLVFRNNLLKRKNEKLQNEQTQFALKRKALELEMQALRSQMNPHFIFNCLNSIDNLIQTNQKEKATTYLARFAKLIRNVLDSSKNNVVPFQNDYESLQLYLQMEQFRCNNKFMYELNADEELLNSDYKLPPLIIQPFVENAIHHGLLNKQNGDRKLTICAVLEDDAIKYTVIDNGVGRVRAQEIKEINKPGHQSYGINITKERVNLYNQNGKTKDITITDLIENGQTAGTKVEIRLKVHDNNTYTYA